MEIKNRKALETIINGPAGNINSLSPFNNPFIWYNSKQGFQQSCFSSSIRPKIAKTSSSSTLKDRSMRIFLPPILHLNF
jgi:hypothetical protein